MPERIANALLSEQGCIGSSHEVHCLALHFVVVDDVFFGNGNQQLRDLPAQLEQTITYAKRKAFQHFLWLRSFTTCQAT
jgi:hypothetical protein